MSLTLYIHVDLNHPASLHKLSKGDESPAMRYVKPKLHEGEAAWAAGPVGRPVKSCEQIVGDAAWDR